MPHLLWLYAEAPLHPGSGSRVSYVDLPVQRERITGFPIIQSSSLKGVLRWMALRKAKANQDGWNADTVAALFGPGPDLEELKGPTQASDFAGAISITDARIALFPVRSLTGVFAWVTAPVVLKRLVRDMKRADRKDLEDAAQALDLTDQAQVVVSPSCQVVVPLDQARKVVLEDFAFTVLNDNQKSNALQTVANVIQNSLSPDNPFRAWMPSHIVLVHDDVFTDLVQIATEIVTRIRIDHATGTVAQGALWSEEMIPSETVFWSVLDVEVPRTPKNLPKPLRPEDGIQLLKDLTHGQVIQLGGDETLGRGLVRITWMEPAGQSS
ncbi:MAG: type III-B CRISPR module RAMP protein Cmr4 [Acidobacteria bacterium]|nr:type III-B CRISPR module RAMP protein Cmr4 [Acidobacteriota bacterium]MDW7984896.1 type III-B CRISPR module RAMP protein Cmr4 [Acidobacteriota bacterium]